MPNGIRPDNIQGAYENLGDPATATQLHHAETDAASPSNESIQKDSQSNDLGDAARNGEKTDGQWANNTTDKSPVAPSGIKSIAKNVKTFFQKKGAIAALAGVLATGGAVPFIGSFSFPFAFIGNLNAKSMLLPLDQYNQDFLSYRLFGANKAASLKNGKKGEFSGLRDADIKKLEARGLEFKGATVKKDPITGKPKTTFTHVRTKGSAKWISAGKEFNREIGKNPAFRKAIVYTKSSYFKSSKSIPAQEVKAKHRVTTNPKIKGKTDADRDKSLFTQTMNGADESIDGKIKNYDDEKDPDNKAKNAAEVGGEAADEIEVKKAEFLDGKFTDAVAKDADMSNIATQMDRPVIDAGAATKGLGSKLWGFVNAAEPLDALCTTYQVAHTAEMIARGIAVGQMISFSFYMKTTVEKAMAGDDDGQSLRYITELLQRKDPETGRSFDSSSYAAFLFTGKLSSEPSSVSAFGGQAMMSLMMGMHALHLAVGMGNASVGRYALRNGCNIITNGLVQLVVTVGLTIFTAGAGTAATKGIGTTMKLGFSAVQKKIAEAVVSKFGKQAIKDELGKIGSEGTLKYFGSRALKSFRFAWKSFTPADKAAFLLAAVGTFAMPYIVNALSGGTVAGFFRNGLAGFEGTVTGQIAYEAQAGTAIGMTPATIATAGQYQSVKDEYEERYIADAKYDAKDRPFDLTTPYSALGSAMFSMQKTLGIANSLSMVGTLKSIASLPLRLPGIASVANAAEDDKATPQKITNQVTGGEGFYNDNDLMLTVTGTPLMVANKKLTFEDVEDKYIKGDNPMVKYDGDDETTGEPNLSIIPGTPLYEYVEKCKDPEKMELDPEYRDDNLDYVGVCVKHVGHPEYDEYDDVRRFISQITPEAKSAEQQAADESSTGSIAVDGFAWPFSEDDYKNNTAAYKKAHTATGSSGGYTGTAWGSAYDEVGVSNKGGGIAIDLGHHSEGTKVYAMFSGVVKSTNLCGAGDGIAIVSDAGGKNLGVAYMHGKNKQFKVGDAVKAGDYIMDQGNFGCNSFGSHLHIGIAYDGKYICPQDVFAQAATGNMEFDFGAMVKKGKPTCGR